jgi:hypothetical protein
MLRQWRRTTRWALFGTAMITLASGDVGHATAGYGPGFPASSWTGTTWRDSTPEERRGYILGITDGLRLATVFDRAEVERSPVVDCAQRLRTERLPRLVENYLDEVSLVIDESTLPFHIWDALVAVCLEDAPQLGGTLASGCSSACVIPSPRAIPTSARWPARPHDTPVGWPRPWGVIAGPWQ